MESKESLKTFPHGPPCDTHAIGSPLHPPSLSLSSSLFLPPHTHTQALSLTHTRSLSTTLSLYRPEFISIPSAPCWWVKALIVWRADGGRLSLPSPFIMEEEASLAPSSYITASPPQERGYKFIHTSRTGPWIVLNKPAKG